MDSGDAHQLIGIAMKQRLSLVTLGVEDLDRSRDFYLKGLGWQAVPQDSDEIVFIQMAGMVLGLYPIDKAVEEHGMRPDLNQSSGAIGLSYNTRSEQEADEVLRIAVEAGATLVKSAEKVFWGGYSGYFKDPDGHLWEVCFNPFTMPDENDGSFVMSGK